MNQNRNKKKGIAKKAISVSLVAAMLATTNVPVWADVIEEVPIGNEAAVESDNVIADEAGLNLAAAVTDLKLTAGTAEKEIENKGKAEWGSTVTAALVGDAVAPAIKWSYVKNDGTTEGSDGNTFDLSNRADLVGKTITCTATYKDDVADVELYTMTRSFTVAAIDVTDTNLTTDPVSIDPQSYDNGREVKPAIEAKTVTNEFGDPVNVGSAAFYVTYSNHRQPAAADSANPPTAAIVFYESAGFIGTVTKTFTIEGVKAGDFTVTLKENPGSVVYSPDTKDYEGALKNAIAKVEYSKSGADPVEVSADNYDVGIAAGEVNEKGTKHIQVTGKGNYAAAVTGTSTETITVEPRPLDTCSFTAIADQQYDNGSEVVPSTGSVVTYKTIALASPTDYSVEYTHNKLVGPAYATFTGTGNYTGTYVLTYQIVAKDFEDASGLKKAVTKTLDGKTFTYTSQPIDPMEQVYTDDDVVQYELNRDFKYSIDKNVNAGTATITVTGINNYAGKSFTTTFIIDKYNMQTSLGTDIKAKKAKVTVDSVTFDPSVTNAATAAKVYGKPAVTVVLNGKTLTYGTDYTISGYSYDLAAKKIIPTIKGIGVNFEESFTDVKDTASGKYELAAGDIVAKNISNTVVADIAPQKYTGYAIRPTIKVTDGKKTLTLGADYEILGDSWSNNTEVGQASVVIRGKGDYAGRRTVYFNIVKNEITAYIVLPGTTKVDADSQKLAPSIVYDREKANSKNGFVLEDGTDFIVVDKDGNKLNTTDYVVAYSNNRAAGTASIAVTGKKSGMVISAANTFEIKPAKLPAGTIKPDFPTDLTYTGEGVTIKGLSFEATDATDSTYKLVEGTDFEFVYENNIEPTDTAKAKVKVVGKGNYASDAGTIVKEFEIGKAVAKVDAPATVPYAGGLPVKPEIKLTNPNTGKALVLGTDYTVAYTQNVDIGTATASLTLTEEGIKHYELGSPTVKYEIVAFNFENLEVSKIADQKYTGEAIEPAFTVLAGDRRLTKDKDYKAVYSDNKEPGTAKIVITPTVDGYYGSKTVEFKIVKDVVTVGVPQNVKVATSTSAFKVTWDAVKDATGYVVYEYDKADTKTVTKRYAVKATSKTIKANPGTSRTFVVRAYQTVDKKNVYCKAADAIANKVAGATKPLKTDIKKVTTGTKTAKVYTTVGKGAIGAAYCVSYNGGKTYAIVAKGPKGVVGSTNYTMKGLKKGAAVIKIRGYVKDHNGKTVYGDWSKAVKVTIK